MCWASRLWMLVGAQGLSGDDDIIVILMEKVRFTWYIILWNANPRAVWWVAERCVSSCLTSFNTREDGRVGLYRCPC